MPIPVLTLAEMRQVERLTAERRGISEIEMIQSAGEAVFETVKSMLSRDKIEINIRTSSGQEGGAKEGGEDFEGLLDLDREEEEGEAPGKPSDQVIAFLCGTGHNGADALAAAVLASQNGYPIVVYQIDSPQGYDEAVRHYQRLAAETDITINYIRSPVDLPVFQEIALIVDGLLGSGLNKDPEGLLQSCIFGMNQSKVPLLSIDIPSGIYGDSPKLADSTAQADATISLGCIKISSCFYPSSPAYGKVGYSPICFDEKLLASQPSQLQVYTQDDAVAALPERDYDDNKYTAGKVLVIAGSRGMHGAAALAANAAMRAGAGLVKLAVPEGLCDLVCAHLLEVIAVPIGEGSRRFEPSHIGQLEELLGWADAVLLGPGLGKAPETLAFLREFVPKITLPTVIDGDALAFFAEGAAESAGPAAGKSGPEGRPADFRHMVATPHAGEYERMGGVYTYAEPLKLIGNARDLAHRLRLHVLLKGPTTLYAPPDGKLTLLPVGNPALATAGTGDVLAGIIAAFLALRPVEQAAMLGAFVHGKTADLVREDLGTHGMVASDLWDFLPSVLKELEEAREDGPYGD